MTNDAQTAIRIPSAVLRAVDALARRLSRPGLRITRATMIRMLVIQGVQRERKRRA